MFELWSGFIHRLYKIRNEFSSRSKNTIQISMGIELYGYGGNFTKILSNRM